MRTTFTSAEIDEARALLNGFATGRRAVQRMSMARLRDMGLPLEVSGQPSVADVDQLLERGTIRVDDDGLARASIAPHTSGHIFRVAVGVTDDPVTEDWSAFDERYQWFGKKPQSVTSGAHLFVLAVGRWRSAVVGLYEAVSAGADRLPDSPDPERWPWALGVKPLAAIPPPRAERVDGQIGPQSGLPERVYDPAAQKELYAAIRASLPPPGPATLEQHVQELEWHDLSDDVLRAVAELGREAKRGPVLARAKELGDWTNEELAARAWYTGSGTRSHIQHLLGSALDRELVAKRLRRRYGSSPYELTEGGRASLSGFGLPYRSGSHQDGAADDIAQRLVDVGHLEQSTRRHMELQDRVADALATRGITPLAPGGLSPRFDLGFELEGRRFVVEVKTGRPASPQQVRLGVGQVLEYHQILAAAGGADVHAVLCLESEPPAPWPTLARKLGVTILRGDDLDGSLDALLARHRNDGAAEAP